MSTTRNGGQGVGEKPIVPFDSDEAAQWKTVTGWVSRDGIFFGADERTARYSGCTHRPCSQCGALTPKAWLLCPACREKKDAAAYAALPRLPWNGHMLYSQTREDFFDSPDDAEDALEEGETLADLRLVLCMPVYGRLLGSDFFCDDLPSESEGELPAVIDEAIEAFNVVVRAAGPLSFEPTKVALAVDGA